MENEGKTAVNEFLESLTEPKQDVFKPEDVVVDDEPEDKKDEDKVLPFHKDPKVQRYIDKEVKKILQDSKPTVEPVTDREIGDDPLADVLNRIIGNDTPEKIAAIKDFKKVLGGLKEDAKREAFEELQDRAQEDVEAEQEAQEALVSGFEDIEETYNVDITSDSSIAKKTRNDFIDFIKAIAPKDEDGDITEYPDLSASFKLFQTVNKAQPTRAKELASRGLQRSSDTSSAPKKGNTWKDVDRYISDLTK